MAVGRERGFAVEALAVYFPLLQTCSPTHVEKRSLKNRWTSTPAFSTTGESERISVS
jgi:hypothetical protein